MTVQWQMIEIPIAGVDQYTDAPHVIAGKMHTLENVRFYKPPTVSRRYGWTELTGTQFGGGAVDVPLRLAGFKKETLAMSASHLYAYSHTGEAWSERGSVSDCIIEQQKVFFDISQDVPEADSGIANGFMVIFWGGSANNVQGAIVDLASNSVVKTISTATTVALGQCRVFAVGSYVFVIVHEGGGGTLGYFTVNTASGLTVSSVSTVPLTGAVGTSPVWDAATLGTTKFLVGYRDSSTNEPMADLFTPVAGVLGGAPDANWANDAAINIPDAANDGAVAIYGTQGEDVYFAYSTDAPSTRAVITSDALAETVAPFNLDASNAFVRMSMCRLTSSSVFLSVEHPVVSGFDYRHIRYGSLSDAGVLSTPEIQDAWRPASKPILVSGSVRQLLAYESDTQATYAWCELTDSTGTVREPRWFGTFSRNRAAGPITNACFLTAPNSYSTLGSIEMALGQKYVSLFSKQGDENVITARSGIVRMSSIFSSTHANQSAPWGDGLLIAGGRPSFYDGNTVAEHGFATFPERFDSTAVATGGVLAAGDLSYVLVYEFLDNAGNIIRSATSEVQTETVGANGRIRVDVDETLLTMRGTISGYTGVFTSVRIVPYRTLSGPPANAVFYRDSTLGYSATRTTSFHVGDATSPLEAELPLQEQLYTTGDILDNGGTPPFADVHTHNNRIFACGAEERAWVWFSQPYQEGEEPRFNEGLRVPMDEDVFCLESLDENLIAFHATGISAVVGDGPAATGGLDLGFGVVTVPTDVGCIVPESLLRTPVGVFFQSAKGIHLLKRDLSVVWIGAPVKRILETYTQVTGAALLSDSQEAVFFVRSLASSGRLIYNLELEQWSFDTCPFVATTGAAVWRSGRKTIAYGTTGSRYFAQGTTTTTDSETASTYPAVKIRTPYIKLNTLQGWQSVRRFLVLANKLGDHSVTIKVDYDYEGTFAETHSWTVAQISALTKEQLEVQLTRRKCESVAFEFLETNDTFDSLYTASAGPEVVSLVCEGGFKVGGYKRMARETNTK